MTMSNQSLRVRHTQQGGVVSAFLKGVLLLGIIAFIGVAAATYQIKKEINASGPLTQNQLVLIKTGMGVNAIAGQLVEDGVIEAEFIFKLAVYMQDNQSNLQAGEYEIPAGSSVHDVINILVNGKPYLHNISFPEGLTSNQIVALVMQNEVLTGEVTLDLKEGELLPETYSFVRGDTRESVIKRMQDAQQKVLTELWDARADELPIKTIEEAIILASVVEKETGVASERPLVASVFVNRLRKKMRLQSDPTVIYGLTGGEPLGRGLRVSELKKETPYNTYIIRGLPPTPIANPGKESLAAVLNPADTDYIFFVADGTGGHAFAATLSEHNKNVRKWREIEKQRQGQ